MNIIGQEVCRIVASSSSCTPFGGWVILTGTGLLATSILYCLWKGGSLNFSSREVKKMPPVKIITKKDPLANTMQKLKLDLSQRDGITNEHVA